MISGFKWWLFVWFSGCVWDIAYPVSTRMHYKCHKCIILLMFFSAPHSPSCCYLLSSVHVSHGLGLHIILSLSAVYLHCLMKWRNAVRSTQTQLQIYDGLAPLGMHRVHCTSPGTFLRLFFGRLLVDQNLSGHQLHMTRCTDTVSTAGCTE